jgi:hypothetical protein
VQPRGSMWVSRGRYKTCSRAGVRGYLGVDRRRTAVQEYVGVQGSSLGVDIETCTRAGVRGYVGIEIQTCSRAGVGGYLAVDIETCTRAGLRGYSEHR